MSKTALRNNYFNLSRATFYAASLHQHLSLQLPPHGIRQHQKGTIHMQDSLIISIMS